MGKVNLINKSKELCSIVLVKIKKDQCYTWRIRQDWIRVPSGDMWGGLWSNLLHRGKISMKLYNLK